MRNSRLCEVLAWQKVKALRVLLCFLLSCWVLSKLASGSGAWAVGKARLRHPGGFVLGALISKRAEYCSAQLAGVVRP